MRRMIVTALVCGAIALTGCSSDDNPAAKETTQSKPSAPPTLDRDAALREEWEASSATYTASLKLDICDAGSEAAIAKFLASDDMPFVVDDPAYDAKQWVQYCASN
ncbi:hypothetical protein ACFTXM_09830 [Streptomyces sp. NPDC056930]|uniref:hypothetical protein n=1 Tax=Streptomyces sp. NPDC056930 TaxID=3345967 RepID=UPI00362DCEC8